MIAITRGIDIVMGIVIIISAMAQSVIMVIKITVVNCQFNFINLFSKGIFYNHSYSILSKKCYTDFIFLN